jgi:hypothetical protein
MSFRGKKDATNFELRALGSDKMSATVERGTCIFFTYTTTMMLITLGRNGKAPDAFLFLIARTTDSRTHVIERFTLDSGPAG